MTDGISRRRLLKRLGAGGAIAALAGCPGGDQTATRTAPPASPPPTADRTDRPDGTDTATDQPENVVNVQAEGGDPNGNESVVPVLRSLPTDNVTVHFPPGTYLMDDLWRVREYENLRIEGPGATIRADRELTGPLLALGSLSGSTGLEIDGLTFDVRGENRGPRPIHAKAADGLAVRNVEVVGRMDLNQDGMRFDVTDPDGTGVVENLSMPHGGSTEYRITGCYVGTTHRGHLTFDSCYIVGFPDNGLYASPAEGRVDVVGGRYENSGVSNVRVSGPATVRNVSVKCNQSDRPVPNMRGIRLREGSDILVKNCEIEMSEVTGSDGAITCAPWLDEATIEDTTISVGADDVQALWAKEPTPPYEPSRSNPLEVRNVEITGDAGRGSTISITERPNALLENVTVCQPGVARDGLHLLDAGETFLDGCRIAVGGDPLVDTRSDVTRADSVLERLDGEETCTDQESDPDSSR